MDNLRHSLAPRYSMDLAPSRTPADRRSLPAILWHVVSAIEATDLPPPEVPSDLPDLPLAPRLHACLRLCVLDLEYAISPGGHVRGLVKLACRISVAFAIVALTLAVVLACVALVLGIVAVIAGQLVVILTHLLHAALLLMGLLAVGVGLLFAVRLLTRSSASSRGRPPVYVKPSRHA